MGVGKKKNFPDVRDVQDHNESVAMSNGRRNRSLLSIFAGRCYNGAVSGKEHMRDERGSSVSPSYRSLRALWVKLSVFQLVFFVLWLFVFVLFVVPLHPVLPFA